MTFLLQAAFISHHTIMNKLYEMVEKSSLVSWSDSFDAMQNAFLVLSNYCEKSG